MRRKGFAEVSKLQTKTMNALIVIDVHAKDVIWGFVEQQVRDKAAASKSNRHRSSERRSKESPKSIENNRHQ